MTPLTSLQINATENVNSQPVRQSGLQNSKKPMRILVVDDDLGDCELIARGFERAGREPVEIVTAHSVEQACEILKDQRFGCIILDHHLPDGFGHDVLERMEEQLLTTPIIGLATNTDPQIALANFRSGAVESIDKKEIQEYDTWRSKVFEAITRFKRRYTAIVLEQFQDPSGVEALQVELVTAARTDPLMKILNRAAITDCHRDLHDRMTTDSTGYAVCMVDIDHFKKFNDRYGHVEGDRVLHDVAVVMRDSLRADDFIARYGGEEIMILLENVDHESATLVASRLVGLVAKLGIPHPDNEPHSTVSVSIGVAVFEPDNPVELEKLIAKADVMMYAAKSGGRNRSVVSIPD